MDWRRVGAIAACAAAVAVASAAYRGDSSDGGIAELGPGAWAAATATAGDAQFAIGRPPEGAVEGARSRPAAVPLITPVPRHGGASIDDPRRVPPRRRDATALSASVWQGDYFNNTSLSGTPALSRGDGAELAFMWGGSPGPGVRADGFSVRWTSTQNFDGGTYDVSSTHDDGARVFVDGAAVLNTWWDAPTTGYTASASIATGAHSLVVEYYHKDGPAVVLVKFARRAAPSPAATQPAMTTTPTPPPAAAPTNTPAPTAPPSAVSPSTATPSPAPATATPAARLGTPTSAPTLPPTFAPAPPTATLTAVPPTATRTPAPPPTATPAASSLNSVDRIIATRGNNLLHHEINLPSMISFWSWGQHGTEDNQSLPAGAGSINGWLVVERDNSQLNTPLNVRVNVRNIRTYVYRPSTRNWQLAYSGLPTWMVRTVDPGTAGPYYDVAPRVEPDGSYSFDMPVGAALHMSAPAPSLRISESGGVLTTVEARVIGPDAGTAKLGMEAGADYRDASGSGGSIDQAGAGQFGLLTTYWRAFDMLSSTLSDAEVRANPPPVN